MLSIYLRLGFSSAYRAKIILNATLTCSHFFVTKYGNVLPSKLLICSIRVDYWSPHFSHSSLIKCCNWMTLVPLQRAYGVHVPETSFDG